MRQKIFFAAVLLFVFLFYTFTASIDEKEEREASSDNRLVTYDVNIFGIPISSDSLVEMVNRLENSQYLYIAICFITILIAYYMLDSFPTCTFSVPTYGSEIKTITAFIFSARLFIFIVPSIVACLLGIFFSHVALLNEKSRSGDELISTIKDCLLVVLVLAIIFLGGRSYISILFKFIILPIHHIKNQRSLSTSSTSTPGVPCNYFIGLENLGNSCFFNSVIQILFMIPFFRDLILETSVAPIEKNTLRDDPQLLFKQIKALFNDLSVKKKPSSLGPLVRSTLKQFQPEWFDSKTGGMNQQDSQEFLQAFINHLKELNITGLEDRRIEELFYCNHYSYNTDKPKPQPSLGLSIHLKYGKTNPTTVKDLSQAIEYQFSTEKKPTHVLESFFDPPFILILQLKIFIFRKAPEEPELNNVTGCIDTEKTSTADVLGVGNSNPPIHMEIGSDADEQRKPEGKNGTGPDSVEDECGEKRTSEIPVSKDSKPKVPLFYSEKICDKVVIPEVLDITDCNNTNFSYRLFAINVHAGDSINSGHYKSYIKSLIYNDHFREWFCFNDSDVSPRSDEEMKVILENANRNAKAYLVFYIRQDKYKELVKKIQEEAAQSGNCG